MSCLTVFVSIATFVMDNETVSSLVVHDVHCSRNNKSTGLANTVTGVNNHIPKDMLRTLMQVICERSVPALIVPKKPKFWLTCATTLRKNHAHLIGQI